MVDAATLSASGFSRTATQLEQTGLDRTLPGKSVAYSVGLVFLQTLFVCALIAGSYFALPWLRVAFDKPIARVVVQGDWKALDKKAIEDATVIYETDTFLSIDLNKLVQNLETQPWVARARARREWPDMVAVNIVEQKPIAYWGKYWMVNAKGRIFEHRGLYQNQPLPHLWSEIAIPTETMNYYQIFEHQLQAVNLRLQGISQNLQGDWQLELNNGLCVILGRSDPASSIRYFVGIYQQVVLPSQRQAAVIDMRYRHGAAIRWQQVAAVDAPKTNKSIAGEKT
jgi:cell division protein FtsQ